MQPKKIKKHYKQSLKTNLHNKSSIPQKSIRFWKIHIGWNDKNSARLDINEP